MPDPDPSAFELVIGLVSPTGVNLQRVCELVSEKLKSFNYITRIIKISESIISKFVECPEVTDEAHVDRTNRLMTAGDEAREKSERDDILAMGAAKAIYDSRDKLFRVRKKGQSLITAGSQSFVS